MKKLVVLVSAKLSIEQRAVQSAHAVGQFAKEHPDWEHGTLILKQVRNLKRYLHLAQTVWREPHWDNRITAIAALGIDDLVEHVKLLSR